MHFTRIKNFIFQCVFLEVRHSRLDLRTVNLQCDSIQIINGHSGIILIVTVYGDLEIYTVFLSLVLQFLTWYLSSLFHILSSSSHDWVQLIFLHSDYNLHYFFNLMSFLPRFFCFVFFFVLAL